MNNYHQYLKHKYMSMKFVSPDEMLDCSSKTYIELTLKKYNKCVTLHEALKVRKTTSSIILFEGNPGIGKSTLAVHICKQWAKDSLLQDYDAVILLPLRDPRIQEAKSISDLLLVLDDDMRENVFKEIVQNNGERICFILEGYDELPKKCMKQFSVFFRLKEELTSCMLVFTSRPKACSYSEIPYTRIITIDGFKKESVDKYISSTFEDVKNGKQLTDTLKSQLYNNPVVESILHVPINLAIICLIFFHCSTLPETLTELYTLLCLRLILRHIVTRTPNEEEVEKLTSLNNLPKSITEQFSLLCFLAYKGIKSKTIIFHAQDLLDFGVDENKIRSLGLLRITSTTSVYGRENSYNFLHLTVQEFCAAWYISKLSTEEQLKVFETYYYNGQFEIVWRFYSGITGLKNKKMLNFMLPHKLVNIRSDKTNKKMIKLMYHVYEAHDDEVCKIVGDYCYGSFANFYPKHLQFFTYSFDNHRILLHAFSYLLVNYNGILKLLDLTTWPITDREFTIIVNSLEKRLTLQNNVTSDKLIIKVSMKCATSQSYSLLANLLTQQYPIVEIYIKNFTMSLCKDLTLLTQSNTLRVLDVSKIKLGPEETMHLADCRNIQLQDLRMRECELGPMGADKIGEMLAHNKSITSIDLSSNNIKDEGVERIVHHIKNGSVLQYINLCNNYIMKGGIGHLIKFLESNVTLTSLNLSHNQLEFEDVCLFLNSLSVKMEYIGLYGYSFIPEAIAATHAMLKVNSFGFLYVISESSKPSTFIHGHAQHLAVYVTSEEVNYRMMQAVSSSNYIKGLQIYYRCQLNSNMVTSLSTWLRQNHSLETFGISITKISSLGDFGIMNLLTCSTSIKKITWKGFYTLLSCFNKLLPKLSDTLEEMTLHGCIYNKIHLQEFDEILQGINQRRYTKGVSNPLQVTILDEKREGFDIYLREDIDTYLQT